MTTPRKLTIAAVILLLGGVMVALVVRQPESGLAITLQGFETNGGGVVTANILVSNTSPHEVYVWLRPEPEPAPLVPDQFDNVETLPPRGEKKWTIELPTQRPCHVLVESSLRESGKLFDRLRWWLAAHGSDVFLLHDIVTLDIPP